MLEQLEQQPQGAGAAAAGGIAGAIAAVGLGNGDSDRCGWRGSASDGRECRERRRRR